MKRMLWSVLIAALIALPAAAADKVIHRGVDLFHTPDNGSSYMDFSKQPIPAGFFCRGSKPFTGMVHWKGVPLATALPGELGKTDTIVERLDDATFDKKGTASTRIQFRALQLESSEPIKTSCGSYKIRVVLAGPQPVTNMKILRESNAGGRFLASLALRAKFVFVPVSGNGKVLELPPHVIRFPPNPSPTWAFRAKTKSFEKRLGVFVDTNFDSVPDTFLPGTSNFAAGWDGRQNKSASSTCPELDVCHDHDDSCGHCVSGSW